MTLEDALSNLKSQNPEKRIAAIEALASLSDVPAATRLPPLINQLADDDDTVKLSALKALGALLPAHPVYVDEAAREMLRLMVQPVGTLVKTAVVSVLNQVTQPMMAALTRFMQGEDAEVRAGAEAVVRILYPRPDDVYAGIPNPLPIGQIAFADITLQQFMEILAARQTVDATKEVPVVSPKPIETADKEIDAAPDSEFLEPEPVEEEESGEAPKTEAPGAPVPVLPPAPVILPPITPAPRPSSDVLKPPPVKRALPAVEIPAPAAPQPLPDLPRSRDLKSTENEEVQFSAYYPREVEPDKWQPMTAYVYKASAANKIVEDAQQQLGGLIATMRRIIQRTRQNIPSGTLITATPYLEGFQFNPPQAVVGFYEDWHRFDFKLRAVNAPLNMAANGRLSFTVEGIIVADIPLSIYVGDAVSASSMVTMSQKLYKSIFCSYSRDDKIIVDRVERVYKALGFDFLRDVHTIKSGEDWNEKLYDMIEKADIFQLFWSKTAAESEWVEKEWRYALSLDRDESNFIRPVYWEEPIPPVPDELDHIHFAYEPTLDD